MAQITTTSKSELRTFKANGAEPGTLLCDAIGRADWTFFAGPDKKGYVIATYVPDDRFIIQPESAFKVAPLTWLLGLDNVSNPVYKGDTVHTVGGAACKLSSVGPDKNAFVTFAHGLSEWLPLAELRYGPPPSAHVSLELTVAEARTLMTLLNNVGGHPERTLRGFSDSVRVKLREAGVEPYWHDSEGNEQYLVSGAPNYFNEKSRALVQPGEDI